MKKQLTFLCLLSMISVPNVNAQSNFTGSGIALQFNGSSGNYVNLGDVYNSLNFPFSFEAWIAPHSYPINEGGIFGSDNNVSTYHGFWFRLMANGTIQIEFGDGNGSGYQYRRGYQTTATVPLSKFNHPNRWTHVAVTCASVTDVHIYFNGVEKTVFPTDGTSTVTQLINSSAPSTLGRTINLFASSDFNGQIDEARLWNISRTQTEIRDFMCRKVDPATAGLIGYWTADESYSGNTVNDNTTPAENGTIVGTVTKTTSGAPIGDATEYLYTTSWSGQEVTLGSPANDQLTAKSITGNPLGVQVYRVDAAPHSTNGLDLTPDYYYGVFCAEGNPVPYFEVTYTYSSGDGIVESGNEGSLTLFKRTNGSINSWSNLNASLDTTTNELSKSGQKLRREYILNVSASEKFGHETANFLAVSQTLSIYPNPANQIISLTLSDVGQTISVIRITDVAGKILKESNRVNKSQVISIDISDLNNGVYFVNALTSSGWRMGKFEVQK